MKNARRFLAGLCVLFCLFGIAPRAVLSQDAPTPPSTFVGERISVEVMGQGPNLILIPGLGCSREVWRPLAEQLKATHKVHLVSIKGFAEPAPAKTDASLATIVEELASYIQRQQIKSPAIIGHSFGGAAALLLAERHPDLPGRIMMVDALPFYGGIFGQDVTVERARPFAEQTYNQIMQADAATFATTQKAAVNKLTKDPASRQRILEWTLKSDRETLASAVRELMTTDLRPDLGKITVPATVLYAWDQQMPGPKEQTEEMYEDQYNAVKQAKLVRIENSFHFIMADQPERFTQEVQRFLK